MATESLSLRCTKSPLTRTSGPQEEQVSSAANAAGAENHRLTKVIRQMTVMSVARIRRPDGLHWADSLGRKPELQRVLRVSERANASFLNWIFIIGFSIYWLIV